MKLTLKYFGLLALCAAALVSCQREAVPEPSLSEDALTRTSYSSTGSIVWNDNDKLDVRQVWYPKNSNTAQAQLKESGKPTVYDNTRYSVTASFDAVSPGVYKGKESEGYKFMYQAFYPASRATMSGTKVSFTLPGTQYPRSNSFDPAADLVISDQVYSKSQRTGGKSVNGLTFSRLSSIGILTIKGLGSNVNVQTVEISAADKPMAGTYTIDINNGKTLKNTTKTISLNLANSQPSNSNDFKVYFTCLPGTYSNVKVSVTTNQGTFSRTISQMVFSQGQATNIPAIQLRTTQKTLMTYNVGAFHKSEIYTYDQIAHLLVDKGANYVSLNEVDKNANRTDNEDQLVRLKTEMENYSGHSYWYHFSKSLSLPKNGQYGNGVVSSDRVEKNSDNQYKYYHFQLTNIVNNQVAQTQSGKDEEVRSVSVLETADCVFASTHLGLSRALRAVQVSQINQWFNSHYGNTTKPVFLCGDFNAEPAEADSLMVLPGNWIFMSDPSQNSFNTHGSVPGKCIDYIFCRKNDLAPTVNAVSRAVILEAEYPGIKSFSDHYPLRVVAEW